MNVWNVYNYKYSDHMLDNMEYLWEIINSKFNYSTWY